MGRTDLGTSGLGKEEALRPLCPPYVRVRRPPLQFHLIARPAKPCFLLLGLAVTGGSPQRQHASTRSKKQRAQAIELPQPQMQ